MATVLKFFKNRKRSSSQVVPASSDAGATSSAAALDVSHSLVSPDAPLKLLRKATINNDLVQVKKLLEQQPSLVNTPLNDSEQTALHLASEMGSLELIEFLLLKCGADPNLPDEQMQTSLHLSLNSIQAFSFLAKQKVVDVTLLNIRKESVLHLLARRFSQIDDELCRLLKKRGLDLNSHNNSGESPLLIACANGHYKTAAIFLELGSAVNQQNKKGETPIYIASQQGNVKLIKTLMKYSANPIIEAQDGSTALDVAPSAEIQSLLKPSLERRTSRKEVKIPLSSSVGSAGTSPRSLARRSMQVSFNNDHEGDQRSSSSGSSNGSAPTDEAPTAGFSSHNRSTEMRRANSQPMNKKSVGMSAAKPIAERPSPNLSESPPLQSSAGIISSSPGRARSRSFTTASNRLVLLDERVLRGGDSPISSTPSSNRGSAERQGSLTHSAQLSLSEQQHMREKIEADLIQELEHILDPDFVVDVINRVMMESKAFVWSSDMDTNKIEVLKWMCEFVAVEQKQYFLEHLYNFYPDKIDVEVIEEPAKRTKTFSSPSRKASRRKSSTRDGSQPGSHRFTIRAKKIPKYEWEIDMSDVVIEDEIGRGSFGTVYRGNFQGQEVAVKRLHAHVEESEIPSFLKEIAIVSQLTHPHILQFLGASLDADLSLVTEYCSLGDLRNYLIKKAPVDPFVKISFALQIAEGLHYLHSQTPPIVHRDLKCSNILITDDLQVKVSDFGLSNTANARSTNRLGTLNWLAPEVLRGTAKYSTEADIYSIGMCFYEIACDGVSPYADMLPLQIVRAIDESEKPQIPSGVNQVLVDIMSRCWDEEASNRPCLSQIIADLSAERDRLRPSFAQLSPRRNVSPRRSPSPQRLTSPRRQASSKEPPSPRRRTKESLSRESPTASPRGARIIAAAPK